MTDHLPDCIVPDFDKGRWICICNQLRACEARVAATFHVVRQDDIKQWERFARDQFDAGYADGQQQVFAHHPEWWTVTGLCKPDCAACRRLTELITEWEDGYEKGLDAAREAVRGVNWFNDEGKMLSAIVATADSIAAIDALMEQP
jgi:hypothetical protein